MVPYQSQGWSLTWLADTNAPTTSEEYQWRPAPCQCVVYFDTQVTLGASIGFSIAKHLAIVWNILSDPGVHRLRQLAYWCLWISIFVRTIWSSYLLEQGKKGLSELESAQFYAAGIFDAHLKTWINWRNSKWAISPVFRYPTSHLPLQSAIRLKGELLAGN